jgi:hypothetical protein
VTGSGTKTLVFDDEGAVGTIIPVSPLNYIDLGKAMPIFSKSTAVKRPLPGPGRTRIGDRCPSLSGRSCLVLGRALVPKRTPQVVGAKPRVLCVLRDAVYLDARLSSAWVTTCGSCSV